MADFLTNMQNAGGREAGIDNNNSTTAPFEMEDLIKEIFRKWYWFAFSIFICLCAGVYYIKTTPKIYKRDATILVKDSRKGGANEIMAFQDILGTGRRNVDNELFVLQSRRLMEEVVDRLGLAVRYVQLAHLLIQTSIITRQSRLSWWMTSRIRAVVSM